MALGRGCWQPSHHAAVHNPQRPQGWPPTERTWAVSPKVATAYASLAPGCTILSPQARSRTWTRGCRRRKPVAIRFQAGQSTKSKAVMEAPKEIFLPLDLEPKCTTFWSMIQWHTKQPFHITCGHLPNQPTHMCDKTFMTFIDFLCLQSSHAFPPASMVDHGLHWALNCANAQLITTEGDNIAQSISIMILSCLFAKP